MNKVEMKTRSLVVIGNGMTGVAGVEQILRHKHDFEVTIFGDETHVNYNRILLGVAGASFAVALPLASRWYPPEMQGTALGIAGAGNSGTVLATLFIPRLAASLGWKAAFGIAAFPVLAVLVVFALIAKESPRRGVLSDSPVTRRCSPNPIRDGSARCMASLSEGLSDLRRSSRCSSWTSIIWLK